MPGPGDDEDDQVLELSEDQQLNPEDEADEEDSQRGSDGDDGADADDAGDGGEEAAAGDDDAGDEETIVTLGDADPAVEQEGDSSVIRQLRKELREARARERERDAPPAEQRTLRPEPTMEDHDFDEDAYKADLRAWDREKAEAETETAQAGERQAAIQRDWEADVAKFEQEKAELKVPDIEEAQDAIASSFNLAQQAVIVKAAARPALLMYALSKSPAKLAELSKITDVIKLAAAVAKLEGTVKVTKRRKGPAIDRPQSGSGSIESKDKKLERLEKEAERTGERTELVRYKSSLKAKDSGKKK